MMDFEDLFNSNDFSYNYLYDCECECDYKVSDEMLSPPISISLIPTKYNQITVANDSDLREINFLRRMQQPSNEEIECLSSNEFTIIPISVNTIVKPISNIKTKLESVQKSSKTEHDFLQRASNRRAIKFQKQHMKVYNENVELFEKEQEIEEELFKTIIW
jgi:hypothetical protein